MDIPADRARLDGGEKMLGLRLDDHPIANQVQCGFPRRAPPAILSRTVFGFDKRIQSVLGTAAHSGDRGTDQHLAAWLFRNADARQGISPPRTGAELGSVDAQLVDARPHDEEGLARQSCLAAPG